MDKVHFKITGLLFVFLGEQTQMGTYCHIWDVLILLCLRRKEGERALTCVSFETSCGITSLHFFLTCDFELIVSCLVFRGAINL